MLCLYGELRLSRAADCRGNTQVGQAHCRQPSQLRSLALVSELRPGLDENVQFLSHGTDDEGAHERGRFEGLLAMVAPQAKLTG